MYHNTIRFGANRNHSIPNLTEITIESTLALHFTKKNYSKYICIQNIIGNF